MYFLNHEFGVLLPAGVEAEEAATSGGAASGTSSKSQGRVPGDLAGTPYESVLLALLEGLRSGKSCL